MRAWLLPVVIGLLSGCAGRQAETPAVPSTAQQTLERAAPEQEPAVSPLQMGLSASLERTRVEAGQPTRLWMRVRIEAPALPAAPRPPANVALVLDTSGSMAGEPIEVLRDAAAGFLDALADGDRVTIVAFGSRARLVLAPTVLSAEARREAKTRLHELRAEGTTDLAGGLQMALHSMGRAARQDPLDRIVLLSDGVPNDAHAIVGLADQARSHGTSITCLGLGLEFDESLLGQIAQRSGGQFHFLESPHEVAALLSQEVLEIERIVARDLVVTLTPGPGIAVMRTPGREMRAVGTHTRSVVLGELNENQTRDLLVELTVPPHLDGAAIELADIHLAFRPARVEGPSVEQTLYVGARASEDLEAITSSRDPELATAVAEIEAADVTVRAVGLARAGQLDEAYRLVDTTIEQLEDDIEAFDAAPLRTALEGLVQLRPTLVTAVPDPAALQKHKGSLPATGSGLGSIELRSSGLREYGRALRTLGM